MLHSSQELYEHLKAQHLENWLYSHVAIIFGCPKFKNELTAMWGGGEMNPYDAGTIILNGWLTEVRKVVVKKPSGLPYIKKPCPNLTYWHRFQNQNPSKEDEEASELLYNYAIGQVKTLHQEFIAKKEKDRIKRAEAKKRRMAGEAGIGFRNVDKRRRDEVVNAYIAETGNKDVDIGKFVEWLYSAYKK